MTGDVDNVSLTEELRAISGELADLLCAEPADLGCGAEASLADEIVICGIVGGKDVGKSTLINALAKTEVSVDSAEVGRGTERPMAYVHEDVKPIVAHRLRNLDDRAPLEVTAHHADAIRNVVLIDLPDFDSELIEHLDTVRTVAPLLDRVLWVLTPRKIGDRAWVEMLADVIKDPSNVHCVLNKVDELLTDADPFARHGSATPEQGGNPADAFWESQQRWVAQSIEASCCSHDPNHRFLIAAAFPEPTRFIERIGLLWDDSDGSKYAADRDAVTRVAKLACGDLDRLRSCVLGPVSSEQMSALKEANRTHELEVNATRIRQHFELDRVIGQLALACDPSYHQQVLDDAMGPAYCDAVADGLRTVLRPDTDLADELLERRVECWPLLRLVHWPFGWLSRMAGRRVSPSASKHSEDPVVDPLHVEGRSLRERIELTRSRLLADHAAIIDRLHVHDVLPTAAALDKQTGAAIRRLPSQWQTGLLDTILERDRRPSLMGRGLLWLILLWFPLLQPVSEGVLRMFSEDGTANLVAGAWRIVSALSAVHLLAGFAVVAGIYVVILAGMYVRALRAVRNAVCATEDSGGPSPLADTVDEILITKVVAPLVKPLQNRLERLAGLTSRLDTILSR